MCFESFCGRQLLRLYVEGQLSDLQRKNCEAIALKFGSCVRTLQLKKNWSVESELPERNENKMCGRITLKVSPHELQELFDVIRGANTVDWTPRYNVAPTSTVMCIRETGDGRELFPARRGLIPPWSKDMKLAASVFQ